MAECWSCGAERGRAVFCSTCGKIQPQSPGTTHFELLGLARAMRLDGSALERSFREAQRAVHPDRYAQASAVERRLSVEQTSALNEAYRTLKDEQKRAEYLMRLEGVQVGAEESRTADPALLMEMLELQEAVESAGAAELERVHDAMRARKAARLAEVGRYFDERQGSREHAVRALDELRYLRRLLERIDLKLEELS